MDWAECCFLYLEKFIESTSETKVYRFIEKESNVFQMIPYVNNLNLICVSPTSTKNGHHTTGSIFVPFWWDRTHFISLKEEPLKQTIVIKHTQGQIAN